MNHLSKLPFPQFDIHCRRRILLPSPFVRQRITPRLLGERMLPYDEQRLCPLNPDISFPNPPKTTSLKRVRKAVLTRSSAASACRRGTYTKMGIILEDCLSMFTGPKLASFWMTCINVWEIATIFRTQSTPFRPSAKGAVRCFDLYVMGNARVSYLGWIDSVRCSTRFSVFRISGFHECAIRHHA